MVKISTNSHTHWSSVRSWLSLPFSVAYLLPSQVTHHHNLSPFLCHSITPPSHPLLTSSLQPHTFTYCPHILTPPSPSHPVLTSLLHPHTVHSSSLYPHTIHSSSLHPHPHTLPSHPPSNLTPPSTLTPCPHFKLSSSFSVNRYSLMSSFPSKQPQICWNKDWSSLLPVPPLQQNTQRQLKRREWLQLHVVRTLV